MTGAGYFFIGAAALCLLDGIAKTIDNWRKGIGWLVAAVAVNAFLWVLLLSGEKI